MSFYRELEKAARRNSSLLCVGLDPRPDMLGQGEGLFDFNRRIINATSDLVCAYKPNSAFYEAAGIEGLEALRLTISYIHERTGLPVILDAKRGDIGSTAKAYARAAFEILGADALTVSPFLGYDSIAPFMEYENKGVFVLCHTSNRGASDFQSLPCPDRPLYELIAEKAVHWNTALVAGATHTGALARIRALAPQAWILLPGLGAQGGDLEASVAAGRRDDHLGLIVNSSRAVIGAADPRGSAMEMRSQIAEALLKPSPEAPHPYKELVLALADIGAVKFGDFTLASGRKSPLYIDLRLPASYPAVLRLVARAYARLITKIIKAGMPPSMSKIEGTRKVLPGDICLAALPYAALPIGTAAALETGLPLIYPRKEVKSYGTGQAVEGSYSPGSRAIVLDDLITTGGSKLTAIASLEAAGLVVEDVVVLIDRGQGGRQELEAAGYRLHSVLQLGEMISLLADEGRISRCEKQRLNEFLGSQ